jgi:general secretion pathway protein A
VYEGYWELREKPFRKTPDPRYLFLNETYEEALERLLFAIEEMELALLTGEVGSGKTLLTRALVDRAGERYEAGMILNPRLPPRQFLHTVAVELGVAEPRFHSNELLDQIQERLLALHEAGRAALLVIDEAHLIPFELVPLSLEDARAYLAHRLTVAGAERLLFSEEAIRKLHAAAAGVPRLLNHLATQALIEGMAQGAEEVDGAAVASVLQDDFATVATTARKEGAPLGARKK